MILSIVKPISIKDEFALAITFIGEIKKLKKNKIKGIKYDVSCETHVNDSMFENSEVLDIFACKIISF